MAATASMSPNKHIGWQALGKTANPTSGCSVRVTVMVVLDHSQRLGLRLPYAGQEWARLICAEQRRTQRQVDSWSATHVGAQQPMPGYFMRSFSSSGCGGGAIARTSRMIRSMMLSICSGARGQCPWEN